MQRIELSVVVPVYNTRDTLARCIESILGQTYEHLDVVLVDDGSTDGSGSICDTYAALDKRVRVMHKRNEGLIIARKTGVSLAKGDIVTFVDSDDWLESEIYGHMIKIFTQVDCDLVSSGIVLDYESSGEQEIKHDYYLEGLYRELDTEIYPGMLWDYRNNDYGILHNLVTKIFKKKILQTVLSEVDSRVFYGEDDLICCIYCLKARNIYITHKAGYHCCIYPNSMSRSANPALPQNTYLLYMGLKKEFMKYSNPFILLRQLKRYILEIEKHNLQMLFDIDLNAFGIWEFDYDMSIFDSDYILYGAGNCGQALYRSLIRHGKIRHLSAWVDKYPQGKSERCLYEIIGAEKIKYCHYDVLVIAVKEKNLAERIQEDLVESYYVDKDKIIWKQPKDNPVLNDMVF